MKLKEIGKLYHGSSYDFEQISIQGHSSPFKDFGEGFYLTSNIEQAKKLAQKRAVNGKAYVYCYELDDTAMDEIKVLELLKYDKEWLDFITSNRIFGKCTMKDVDIVYDRLADNKYDKLNSMLKAYATGEMEDTTVIDAIKFKDDTNDQFCFKTKKALNILVNRKQIIRIRGQRGDWYDEQ